VVIFSGDEANPVTTHVLVNAIDGTILKAKRERAAINGGKLNSKVLNLPKPEYPEMARRAGASGTVAVEVTIDESGNVIAARAIEGHPLLQAAAVAAARGAQFVPTRLNGEPVKVTGVLTYEFVAN
jgi:protein TonB